MNIRRRTLLLAPAALAAAGPLPTLRIGALRYGSLAWELEVIRTRRLAPGVSIEVVPLAATPAAQVALLGRRIDIIVQDWLWVSRQRATGSALTFSPTSSAVGAIVVPADSPLRRLTDLAGRRLGVAGSPLDKSYLILLADARRGGFDLAVRTSLQFGAPPLLQAELAAGRLDAVLTYWPFAARAEAAGLRSILTVEQAVQSLGVPAGLPFVGYVFAEDLARAQRAILTAFLAAGRQARAILLHDDAAWQALRPMTGVASDAEFSRVVAWYRSGVVGPITAGQVADAGRLYDMLAALGGPALTGPAPHLSPGTFWTG